MIDKDLSRVISLLRWPLTVLVVFIHVRRPETSAVEEWWLRNICSVAVPVFFMISGILFFQGHWSTIAYTSKLKKRVHTLLIPYLLWCLIALIVLVAPHVTKYEYTIGNVLSCFWATQYSFLHEGSSPIDFPLWYVRDLMVCCLMAPIYYHIIKKTHALLPIVGFILFSLSYKIPTIGISTDSVAFFSLGAFYSIWKYNPAKMNKKPLYVLSTIALGVLLADIWLYTNPIYSKINQVTILLLIFVIFPWACKIARNSSHITETIIRWGGYSFIIYSSHAIIIRHISSFTYSINGIPSVIAYILTAVVTLTICMIFSMILKRFPRINTLLGGR